jgi:hypothetical protein
MFTLQSPNDYSEIMNAYEQITKVYKAYAAALTCPYMHLPQPFEQGLLEKLKQTIIVLGYGALSDTIIPQISQHLMQAENGLSSISPLHYALKTHILNSPHRFANNTRATRLLLRKFAEYANSSSINLIETAWKEVLASVISEECIKILDYKFQAPLIENDMIGNTLVEKLLEYLQKFRHVSKMDMSMFPNCIMSADIALSIAFRRLPKECSVEVTKAVAIRLSMLIDAFRMNTSTLKSAQSSWPQTLDQIIDLIQVITIIEYSINMIICYNPFLGCFLSQPSRISTFL